MISLRQRLIRGLALILCVVFAMHWLAADWVIRTVAEKQMTTRLSHDGDSLSDTLTPNANGQLNFDSYHLGSIYDEAFSGHYFVVQIDTAFYYSRSLQNLALAVKPLDIDETRLYHLDDGPKQQPLLVFGRRFKQFGHQVSISVAEDLTAIGHDITAIRLVYLGLTLLVLLSAVALQSSDVKRALRTLNKVKNQLADIASGQRQQVTLAVPAEIKPLVVEVNRLLMLVVRRLQQSRTAIGNLAHALKTPLAMLFRIADNPVLADHPELQQQLKRQTATIHRCIERELKRARIAGNQQTNTMFNPYQELASLSQLLQTIYSEKSLQIDVNAPDLLVNYDREDFFELIGNLLDNACKWAKHHIVIEISFTETLAISVADDGPGCANADAQLLTQRGLRLDESVTGHGLGLAIVRDITEFYGGSFNVGRSPQLGGFLATVFLPLNLKYVK
ncbi:MAG: sensor histidine kinase [Methylovulum sp.]|nr:sensor histidine kinase [Methylovulum sp.]